MEDILRLSGLHIIFTMKNEDPNHNHLHSMNYILISLLPIQQTVSQVLLLLTLNSNNLRIDKFCITCTNVFSTARLIWRTFKLLRARIVVNIVLIMVFENPFIKQKYWSINTVELVQKTCLCFFGIALCCRIHDDTFVTAVTILTLSIHIINRSSSSILCEVT